jgi:hypothetical protein
VVLRLGETVACEAVGHEKHEGRGEGGVTLWGKDVDEQRLGEKDAGAEEAPQYRPDYHSSVSPRLSASCLKTLQQSCNRAATELQQSCNRAAIESRPDYQQGAAWGGGGEEVEGEAGEGEEGEGEEGEAPAAAAALPPPSPQTLMLPPAPPATDAVHSSERSEHAPAHAEAAPAANEAVSEHGNDETLSSAGREARSEDAAAVAAGNKAMEAEDAGAGNAAAANAEIQAGVTATPATPPTQ